MEIIGSVSAVLGLVTVVKAVCDAGALVAAERKDVSALASQMTTRATGIQALWDGHRAVLEKVDLKNSFDTLIREIKDVEAYCTSRAEARKGAFKLIKSLIRAGRISGKLRQLNERISGAHQELQSYLAVKNLCVVVDLDTKLSELLGRLQNVQISHQYRETSIYAQDKNQMFVQLTESFATLNVLSTDPTNLELYTIQLSLDEYREIASNNPTMLQFTTEDGKFWSFDKTMHTGESLLRECEGLIQYALSRQKYSPVFVIRKLRRLSGVLQLLNLQEASVAAGECAVDLAREQAKKYIDLREELVITLTTVAHLREADFDKSKVLYQDAINIRKSLSLEDPSLEVQTVLGDLLFEAGETAITNYYYHDGRIWFEEAVAIRRRIFKQVPTYENGYSLVKALNWNAVCISRVSPADPLVAQTFQRAITTSRLLVAAFADKDHNHLIRLLHNLGETYIKSGRVDLAIPPLEEALPLQRIMLRQSNTSLSWNVLALILEGLAKAYAMTGNAAKALPLAEECLGVRRNLRRSHPDIQRCHMARVLGVLAEALRGMGRDDEAIETLAEAIFIARQENVLRPGAPIRLVLMQLADDLGSLLASRSAPLEHWTLVFETMLLWEAP